MDISSLYLLLLMISYSTAKTTKQLEAMFTCNGEFSFYYKADKSKLLVSNDSTIANYTLHPGTEVVSVRCRNFHSKPWIIGSVSNGLVTDTRWKCFSLPKHLKVNSLSWAKPETDDSQWPRPSRTIQTWKRSRMLEMKRSGYQPLMKVIRGCSAGAAN
ncbi:hypothetical protein OS493_005542 [Desmophyllum pertusum]|uniref:Uncharacterized protein n=1 Tax=Desmophyllum pertusum TaxID=174260 RepID=A0A9W9YSG3_9CNID|nr:hypothetical protein OS493_005542 [Desmophyllum pertusum]